MQLGIKGFDVKEGLKYRTLRKDQSQKQKQTDGQQKKIDRDEKAAKGGQMVRIGKSAGQTGQKIYERILLQQGLGGEGCQVHELNGHGSAVTRRKASKETRSKKMNLGRQEKKAGNNGDEQKCF